MDKTNVTTGSDAGSIGAIGLTQDNKAARLLARLTGWMRYRAMVTAVAGPKNASNSDCDARAGIEVKNTGRSGPKIEPGAGPATASVHEHLASKARRIDAMIIALSETSSQDLLTLDAASEATHESIHVPRSIPVVHPPKGHSRN